jgi:hypothetical protein
MKALAFTPDDLNALLRYNNIPPSFRDKTLALSYRPISLRFLRVLIAHAQFSEKQVEQNLRMLGLFPEAAKRMAHAIVLDVQDRLNPVRSYEVGYPKRFVQATLRAYQCGTIDRPKAFDRMSSTGLSDSAINVYLNSVDSDIKCKLVSGVIGVTKKDYMDGAVTLLQARQILASIGIAQARSEDYIGQWQVERTLTVKMAGTGQLLGWYAQGIIDYGTLLLRLQNLGWIQPDLLAFMAEGEQKLQKRQAALQAAALRSAQANARAIQKLLAEAKKQQAELVAELKRLQPVGRLIKWARQGSISEIYFENSLRAQEYPPEIIARYWQEVLKDGPLPATKRSKPSKGDALLAAAIGASPETTGQTEGTAQPPGAPSEPIA